MARLWTGLLLHAAYILLSEASPETRCYWCGPLAEQVHRSRRSAPCGASDHVTVCELGYNYCAIVATSPPRVESRYCVKVYQDECYPVYCNSTKTWKMTCPCRGDLCNGPNAERENEAFALLPKLVAKTHNARIKKRTPNASPHLIKHERKNRIISNDDAEIHNMSNLSSKEMNNTQDNKLIVNENDSNIDGNPNKQSGNMQSDQPVNIIVEHHSEDNTQSTAANVDSMQTSTTVNNQLIEIEIHVSDPTEKPNALKGNECTDSPTTAESNETDKNTELVKVEESSMATTAKSTLETEGAMKTTGNINAVENETIKSTDTVQQTVMETKHTDKPHDEPPAGTTEIMPKDQPMNSIDQMQNDAPILTSSDTVHVKTTELSKVDQMPTKDTMKASSGIPTAEALQQNGSPPVSTAPVVVTEKPTDAPTTEGTTAPTVLTTKEPVTLQTTTPAPRRKNSSVRITFSHTLIALIYLVYLSM
ncbi:uncharacterized protein DDB_G0283697-like [Leguminivora glycinivorella]|uniref:uncharacterized protein DDB_G0283697-like n=1 Tax=Leguminivora glycinivorella TaxID=1035111 RepID=UPI00200FE497|nr:uncharacterized protein DDB_G0283697-like [Leguminivora glycinivorella]XP_047988815.1 uncharacterized protein DDB_G0283697-like [Leguminivora glycinivorella]XP_047988825.1 uncharacterized protein DDB_G0283697-like [Leguminivora glycinivorella]